jgi:hypothetical protein
LSTAGMVAVYDDQRDHHQQDEHYPTNHHIELVQPSRPWNR